MYGDPADDNTSLYRVVSQCKLSLPSPVSLPSQKYPVKHDNDLALGPFTSSDAEEIPSVAYCVSLFHSKYQKAFKARSSGTCPRLSKADRAIIPYSEDVLKPSETALRLDT
jgi:hypothetical protein